LSRVYREEGTIKDWFVYMLKCNDGTYYCGITNNIENRLKAHQNGIAARYTAQRLPVRLCYSMGGHSQSEARKEEFRIKKLSRKQKESLGKI